MIGAMGYVLGDSSLPRNAVIYHAGCADGFTAAWVAERALELRHCSSRAVELLPWHHGVAIDQLERFNNRDVYVLDFSFPLPVLQLLAEHAWSVTVLDHHKTAEAQLTVGMRALGAEQVQTPAGPALRWQWLTTVFDMQRSGARLAFDFFRPILGEHLATSPRLGDMEALVERVQDRDLWRFQLPRSREHAARVKAAPLELEAWDELAARGPDAVADEGAAMLMQIEAYVEQARWRAARGVLYGLEEAEVPIVNTTFAHSELIGRLAEEAPYAIGYQVLADEDGGERWIYSLRSRGAEGVDVSEIATSKGGGGHRNAAGFTTRRAAHEARGLWYREGGGR